MMNRATFDFIRQHADADVRQLALQGTKDPEVNLTFALEQIAGRQKARTKLPSWAANDGIIYPPHLSMEQCSSETTALYKARLAGRGETYVDLTGGFGVDFYFMSQGFSKRIYVEQNADLCTIVEHNMQALGLQSAVVCSQTAEYLSSMPHADVVYLDPARRNEHGGRTYSIEDCSPNVLELMPRLMEKAERVILKLSPMLDIAEAERQLKGIREIHIVSVNGECKETLFVLQKEAKTSDEFDENEPKIICVNLLPNQQAQTFIFSHFIERNATCHYTSELKHYLYEPNASVMKAMAFKSVAQLFHVEKLHPSSQLYTSDTLIPDFPGRIFEITDSSHFNKKELKTLLKDIQKANLTVRNFPLSVAELRKRLKLHEGGTDYLFATTLADDSHVLILCKKTLS